MTENINITADAQMLQERDEFRAAGWVKALSPAKVNLHLAIGKRRADGYHEAATVMHALSLHDIVYLRHSDDGLTCRMTAGSDITLPDIPSDGNLAAQAVAWLAEALGLPASTANLEIRIEKNVPAQAGLGGGSSNAAAALAGAACLWGVDPGNPAIEAVARSLGADVAFFLHGGCAYLEGAGDEFVHALAPSRQAVALVKPEGGVSTAEAYRRFDEQPSYASEAQAAQALNAPRADEVALFNNLAGPSESLMPELTAVRTWLTGQPHVKGVLLSGSGAATFALCEDFAAAAAVVSAARAHGWWARATSLSPIRAVATGQPAPASPSNPVRPGKSGAAGNRDLPERRRDCR